MLDLKLCAGGEYDGDLYLTESGDIETTDDILQGARTAIGWILDEWRLGPEIGLDWYNEIWVKRPNLDNIKQEFLRTILAVDGVKNADVRIEEFDRANRTITLRFCCTADDGETSSAEVTING